MSKIDQFIHTCREKGLNVTYQRILIYKSLVNTNNHPTAEVIYQEVKNEYPSISLATVYKTLELLAENGIISKVTHLHDLARYDGNLNPHHHLVCLNCKKVVDICKENLNQLSFPDHKGFHIMGYRIQFEGLCQECNDMITQESIRKQEMKRLPFCSKT